MGAITYLLQVSGCMAIFYLFYYVLLNRLTFFTINRYYLLVTLVLSFVIPALTIPVHESAPVLQLNSFHNLSHHTFVTNAPGIIVQPGINWLLLLQSGYLLIAAGLFMRLMVLLARFFAALRNKQVRRVGHIHIVHGNKKLTNGSFLNYIFLDDEELNPSEIQQIIAHEMLHVKLMHSVDRILVKIIQIILWFNPFAWLYARSIEENHEFEVDREIARSTNKLEYADLLLHLSVAAQGMIYHSFSKIPLKKRIIMLFNQPSANMKKLIYVLIVPVLLLSCMAFATFRKDSNGNYAIARKLSKPEKSEAIVDTAKTQVINTEIVPSDVKTAGAINNVLKDTAATGIAAKQTDTAARYSPVKGLDKLGPNPLVLIDGKEYPSDILYKISESCLRGVAMMLPALAVQKFGDKAKDGCVQIKTGGIITYMKPVDQQNLAKLSLVPKNQFFTRTELKDDKGNTFDRISVHLESGGGCGTDVSHNGKVAYLIDKVFYNEESFKNLSPEKIAAIDGRLGFGVQDLSQKRFPNVDLHGYEAIFHFQTTGPAMPMEEGAKAHWEQYLPSN